MDLDSKQKKIAVLSALASSVLVSETWFIFTYEIYVYIAECVVFKMRYAHTFNKFTVPLWYYFTCNYLLGTQ